MSDESEFMSRFNGSFKSVLRWDDLDMLWGRLRTAGDGQWYVYAVGEQPPAKPVDGDDFDRFILEVDQLLRDEHDEDYCGIVYVDNPADPGFVKIYDPNNLGSSCGSSGTRTLPGWVLSKIPPLDLKAAFPLPNNRRRWWQRVFSG